MNKIIRGLGSSDWEYMKPQRPSDSGYAFGDGGLRQKTDEWTGLPALPSVSLYLVCGGILLTAQLVRNFKMCDAEWDV